MLTFPQLLVPAAKNAGVKVPEDLDNYDAREYPHWHVYCFVQLGAPMPFPTAHWDNAKVIASIGIDNIRLVTYEQLLEAGLAIGQPIP